MEYTREIHMGGWGEGGGGIKWQNMGVWGNKRTQGNHENVGGYKGLQGTWGIRVVVCSLAVTFNLK